VGRGRNAEVVGMREWRRLERRGRRVEPDTTLGFYRAAGELVASRRRMGWEPTFAFV
jgi:hypothetical protein